MASLDPEKIRQLRQSAIPREKRRRLRFDTEDRAALVQLAMAVVLIVLAIALLLLAALTAGWMVHIFRMAS